MQIVERLEIVSFENKQRKSIVTFRKTVFVVVKRIFILPVT